MRLQDDDGSPATHPFDKPLKEYEGVGRTSEKLDPSNGTKQLVITAADGPIALVWRCVVWPSRCSKPSSQETLCMTTASACSFFFLKPPDGLARMER